MNNIIEKMNHGGPVFTYTILVVLLIIIGLFAKSLLEKKENYKAIELIKSFSWFAVAWGFLGRTFGLIMAFDMVAAVGELTPRLLSEGLKMALIDPLFGIMVFALARVFVLILIGMQKDFKPQKDE